MATYTGTWDHDKFTGTSGNDSFVGIAGGDTVDGGLGDDTISVDLSYTDIGVTYNAIQAATTTGNEPLWYMSIRNVEHLGTLKTGSGIDTLTISAAQGAFVWDAGAGADMLKLDLSNATAARTTGPGIAAGMPFEVHISSSNALVGQAFNIESVQITGSRYSDWLGGTAGNDTITGGLGDDTLQGFGGKDNLDGGDGFDRLIYISGSDANVAYDAVKAATATGYSLFDGTWVHNIESFSLTTGQGNDTVSVSTAQKDFSWAGKGGVNTLIADYSTSTGGVTTTWQPTTKFGPILTLHTVEMGSASATTYMTSALKLLGSAYGDSLHGTDGADSLYGQGGNDTLDPGMSAADIVDGGAGDDIVNIDYHAETRGIAYNAVAAATSTGTTLVNGATFRSIEHVGTLTTGSGNDTLTISATQGAFTWVAGDGSDTLVLDLSAAATGRTTGLGSDGYNVRGYPAGSAIIGLATQIEQVQVTGTKYADVLTGMGGDDTLTGGLGDDTLSGGGGGADVLDGGVGYDRAVLNLFGDVVYDAVQAMTTTGTTAGGATVRNMESFDLSTSTGNDLVIVSTAQKGFSWVAGGGNDTLAADYSTSAAGITVSLITGQMPGPDLRIHTVEMGAGVNADAVLIEAAQITGSAYADTIAGTAGDDTIFGGGGADSLSGGDGNDYLSGGGGGDSMTGGAGNDTYLVDNDGDVVAELANGGTDTVISNLSYYYMTNNVENLTLATGAGDGYGNDLNNLMIGNDGANALLGFTGNDTLLGMAGDDTLYPGAGADLVDGGAGIDAVYLDYKTETHDISYNSVAAATSAGTSLYNGTVVRNVEKMTYVYTGSGNDTLIVSAAQGIFTWNAGTGNDTLIGDYSAATSAISVNGFIPAPTGNVTRIAFGGSTADSWGVESMNITGSAFNDTMMGHLSGDDTLNGGLGADTMTGFGGNDVYYVDNIGDVVTESADSGTDTVLTTLGFYALGANVENLTLLGTGKSVGSGNELNNVLTGNAAANTLNGNDGNDTLDGGAGADTMNGGKGDDVFYVDNVGDVIGEFWNEGNDTVIASVSYSLAGINADNLFLTGVANLLATGNGLANVLVGNTGNNTLNGNAGNDTLTGGGGQDVFLFGTGSGHDVITDFHAAENDTINVHAYAGTHAVISQHGADAWIDFGNGNIITVAGVSATDAAFLSHIVW